MTENRFIENLSTEVDFRGVEAGDRTATLLQAYERLGPEEGFILVRTTRGGQGYVVQAVDAKDNVIKTRAYHSARACP